MRTGEPGRPGRGPARAAQVKAPPPVDPPGDEQAAQVLRALLSMQRQSWEQGVTSHALLDLGLFDLADVVAHDAVARQTAVGKLGEIDDHGLVNSAALGEVVRRAAWRHQDAALLAAFDRQLTWVRSIAPRADDGTLFHIEGTREVWVDTVYMVVPLLVLAGHEDEAAQQLHGHRERLYDPAAGLYAHKWDEDLGDRTRAAHWGSGNGWVAAGCARAIRLLGPGAGGDLRQLLQTEATTVIDACLAHRRDDGLFHDVVDDPASFVEATLVQMLAYAVTRGMVDGWLPRRYADTGASLRRTARAQVDQRGVIARACGAPRFDRPGTSAEAQAFYLLTSAAAQTVDEGPSTSTV